MAFQVSPGVNISEIDLSTSIANPSVSDAAIACSFAKGPVNEVTTVTSEKELVEIFGAEFAGNIASAVGELTPELEGLLVNVSKQMGISATIFGEKLEKQAYEEFGYDLGYDWDNLPDLSDMDANTPPAAEGI